ncbi:MAG: histidinol dehydrogenase [Bacteroidetes bacterium MedPE-SWsnd-G2]|nr:MAG: histidinol dehydrogenase [Bacteroidetes bacterium MedPE-SWsnd-G2]
MKVFKNPSVAECNAILKRPYNNVDAIESTVIQIFDDVKRQGDNALKKYTAIFDGVDLNEFWVSPEDIEIASENVSPDLKDAMTLAKSNITKFHKSQSSEIKKIETSPGVICWSEQRGIERVGLYIPGGTAPLFSTVLMLAIPAKLAGCKEIILFTPPKADGSITNEILYAAKLCGVTKIVKLGGIQAIAAMTFGTASISKVNKIFGPGNQFVTVAKQLATKYNVAIDMPAGPSELLVYADKSANPIYVASDLLSQAEHGPDSQVVLVSPDCDLISEVKDQLQIQIKKLSRQKIAEKALSNSKLLWVESQEEAIQIINEYAPEHLIVCATNEIEVCEKITNAGSVFVGNFSPESAGDYASGTNHTLPTNGFSKSYSGVNLSAFQKSISFQKLSKEGLLNIGKSIELMAEAEGLMGHKNAVSLRLKDI